MHLIPFFLAALAAVQTSPIETLSPLETQKKGPIRDSWIAKLRSGASSDDLQDAIADMGVNPTHVFDFGDFKGFSFVASPNAPSVHSKHPAVFKVEADQVVTINSPIHQEDPPYGLARISHRVPGATTYDYDSSAGTGSTAYVIDTGIYLGHREFQGRATFGANFAGEGNNNDGNGHGTHVSGTIGGVTFGVANNVSLIAVKVFDATGQGSISGVIAGIEFAVSDAKNNSRIEKSVANLSLGGGFSEMLNAAATEAVNEGLFLAVAAGNGDENGIGQPIRNVSPASAPRVCTVAAIDQNDVRASFSNFGRVDVFAPGVNVLSAYIGSPNTAGYLSGTSMSTPHVAGLVAYLLGLPANGAKRGGLALCDRIKRLSTKDAVKDARGQNRIAYNGAQELVHEQGQTWG